MPTLTVTKTVTYNDPDSATPYTMTATIQLDCETAHRTCFDLSASASTKIWENNRPGLVTANPQFTAIKNVGDNSAYLLFDDTASTFIHELPAGAILEFFGETLLSSDAYANPGALSQIYASGDTKLEVDHFM